jgi:hypothetical protein
LGVDVGECSTSADRIARLVLLTLLALAAAAAVALTASAGRAYGCSDASHCYGIAEWDVSSPSGFHGGDVNLRTNCMSLSDYSGHFIDNEMWVVRNGNWVETGLTEGTPIGAAHRFFWADQRPSGGGYHEHFSSGGFSLNTYYEAHIHWTGNGTWNVFTGPFGGTSTSQFDAPAYTLQTGTEVSSADSPHTYGSSSSMQYYDLGGHAQNGWGSGSGHAYLYSNGSAYVNWASTYDHIRDGVGATC